MKSIQIEEPRFGVEPEIVAKLARTAVFHQQQRDELAKIALNFFDTLVPQFLRSLD